MREEEDDDAAFMVEDGLDDGMIDGVDEDAAGCGCFTK
jgi:hypothetical protein